MNRQAYRHAPARPIVRGGVAIPVTLTVIALAVLGLVICAAVS